MWAAPADAPASLRRLQVHPAARGPAPPAHAPAGAEGPDRLRPHPEQRVLPHQEEQLRKYLPVALRRPTRGLLAVRRALSVFRETTPRHSHFRVPAGWDFVLFLGSFF